jgi:hypothetical protein
LKDVLCLLLFLSLTNIATAQTQEETMLTQAIERLRGVMEKPDSLILADLASNNLEYVHSSGTVRDKRGFVDEFMKGWTKVTNVTFSNQTIKIVGDKAIVRHRMVADAHNPGYPSTIDIIILMVWAKEGGRWKMLARQAAKLPQ